MRHIKKRHAGRIARIGDEFTAHPETQKILGRQNHGKLFENSGLMDLKPEKLGRGEARHGRHPGDLPDIGKFPVEGRSLDTGAPVIPQNGRAQNLALGIENNGPVHLPGKPDCRDARPFLAVPGNAGFCRPSAMPATSPAGSVPTSRAAAV